MAAYTEINEDDVLAAYKVKYEANILLTKCQLHTLLSNLQPELILTLKSGRVHANTYQPLPLTLLVHANTCQHLALTLLIHAST